MKTISTFILLFIATLSLHAENTQQPVNGFWKNDQHQVVIKVELTEYGLKVIRTDQDQWYRYDWTSGLVYTDTEGNSYTIHDTLSMTWQSYDGRQKLDFRKLEDKGEAAPDRDYHSSTSDRLSGQWVDLRRNAKLEIIRDRHGFKARVYYGRWRYYQQFGRTYFEDAFGNSFRILRSGDIEYRDRRFRKLYHFQKVAARPY